MITCDGYVQPISIAYSHGMGWCVWETIGMQSDDVMSRQYSYSTPLYPTMCNCYWLWANHLETWSGLTKSIFCLGKAQKAISNSHHKGGLHFGCRNIVVLQFHYKGTEHQLVLRKGRLDTRLFTSNPHAMGLLRYQGLQLPLAWRKGEYSDHVDLAILLPSRRRWTPLELSHCKFKYLQ